MHLQIQPLGRTIWPSLLNQLLQTPNNFFRDAYAHARNPLALWTLCFWIWNFRFNTHFKSIPEQQSKGKEETISDEKANTYKKKVTYGQAVIIALYKVPVEDCVRDALFCEVCCIFDEALGEVPYHYRLYGVIHQLSYKANSHWATPAWPTHIPHLTTWLYLCHSPHSISKRPITWPHWCRAAMFDLRHGFSSKGRDFPLPFSLWNSHFKEKYQESNVNYFIILEVMLREKNVCRLR